MKKGCHCTEPCGMDGECVLDQKKECHNMKTKIVRERILDAMGKALEWEEGEIAGIDIPQFEMRLDAILSFYDPKPIHENNAIDPFCNGICAICGKATNNWSGNPADWGHSIQFFGSWEHYHMLCLQELIKTNLTMTTPHSTPIRL